MAKLQEGNGGYHLNLPIALVRLQKWEKGQEFAFVPLTNGDILITRVEAFV